MSEELFPASFMSEQPKSDRGLIAEDEQLWFSRLSFAREKAKRPGAHWIWKKRVEKCRDFLARANMALTAAVASRSISDPNHPWRAGAESDTRFGLFKAIDAFDLSRGVRFSTQAHSIMTSEIRMTLRREIRQSREKATDPHPKENGHDSPLQCGTDTAMPNTELTETQEYIQSLLLTTCLSDQERTVIHLRFFHEPPLTLEDAGNKMDLTKVRVFQIEQAAMAKLKNEMEHPGEMADEKVHRRHLILRAMDSSELSAEERAALRLAHLVEPTFSTREIADRMGMRVKTVSVLLSAARRKLNTNLPGLMHVAA